jgi:tRNA nucleotidyltransferase (CCA-adding enzyme)
MSKIDSPYFKDVLTPELNQLSDLFHKNGFEIRIAGGAVRDLLMGKSPADVDFATTATPDQMKDMFTKENIRMINALGEKHGTITARINDAVNFEVTTLRIDKVTDGRRAEVEYTKCWETDANRRDLTINSMFLGLDGTLYDYFNGEQDLKNRVVKFVGNPVTRIQEDYLRILRYFRFYGRIADIHNNHCQATLDAIRDNVKGLDIVSGERIWSEWKKILAGNHAGELTLKMIEVGLSPHIGLPPAPNTEEFKRVWTQSQDNKISLQPATLLAGLLTNEDEVWKIHARLKMSGVERDNALFVIAHRADKPDAEDTLRPYQFLYVDGKNKDIALFIQEVLRYRGETELLQRFQQWDPPRFPLTGHHLKEANVPPGKGMTFVLSKIKDEWKQSNFTMSLEAMIAMIPSTLSSASVEDLKRTQPMGKRKREKSKQR